VLSPNEQIVLRSFAEQTKADIQTAIKTKRITKFGAVNSSGRLHDSVEIQYTDNGFKILANGYIEGLIDGIAPGQSTARVLDIKTWIQEKPVNTPLPINTLAYLITRSISKKGNMVWRTHKGSNSGLLEDALKQEKFTNFIDLIASKAVVDLNNGIVEAFDLQTE
tara:strand:+ start:263 stop:757 length:495 start_codon:yes stop_codon:yes gene_type:complete